MLSIKNKSNTKPTLICRATTRYGYDRYWRYLRTFTLHDPVDYKLQDVGDWLLNDILPILLNIHNRSTLGNREQQMFPRFF